MHQAGASRLLPAACTCTAQQRHMPHTLALPTAAVIELAQQDGNFTAFLAAARAAGVADILNNPSLVGTLFVPPDSAFNALVAELGTNPQDLLRQKELLSAVGGRALCCLCWGREGDKGGREGGNAPAGGGLCWVSQRGG